MKQIIVMESKIMLNMKYETKTLLLGTFIIFLQKKKLFSNEKLWSRITVTESALYQFCKHLIV